MQELLGVSGGAGVAAVSDRVNASLAGDAAGGSET